MGIPGFNQPVLQVHAYSQAEVDKLVEAAYAKGKAEGRSIGYSVGYQEAENEFNPPPPPELCPLCGTEVKVEHEPAFQEYPGAGVQGGYTWKSCPNKDCDWDGESERDLGGYNIRENTRGW